MYNNKAKAGGYTLYIPCIQVLKGQGYVEREGRPAKIKFSADVCEKLF